MSDVMIYFEMNLIVFSLIKVIFFHVNSGQYKMMQKNVQMTETLAYGYSSESTQQGLSNEYQHDRVFKNLCIFLLWMKVASALEGLLTGIARWLFLLPATAIYVSSCPAGCRPFQD